jgi:hypothetical protein
MLPSWNITTADTNAWQVAKLLQANQNAVAGTRATTSDTVLRNYMEGYSTVANPNRTLSTGGSLTYGAVKTGYTSHFLFTDNYITTDEARTGLFDPTQFNPNDFIVGGSYNADDLETPGYYAFRTEFSLSPEMTILTNAYLNIDLVMRADDTLEGIFLNGQDITKYSSLKGAIGISVPGGLFAIDLELTGSVLLDDLIGQGLFLLDDANTFEFVIRNGNSYDSPLGFFASGNIDIGDQQFTHSFNPTPEPATLLICLTCGGLALAIRRRKNKKTE